jgi:hypothetical protein
MACPGGLTVAHGAGGLISAFYARFFATFGFRLCAASLTRGPLWQRMPPILSARLALRLALGGTTCRFLLSPSLGALYADR